MSAPRVLVVDDNPLNLKLAAVALEADGFDVRTAEDAEAALVVLGTGELDLVLMDIQLPGMDGLELTRRLKADPATRGVRVVALTAYAMKGDERRVRDAGCDGYIAKPVDPIALPDLVRAYLPERTP